MHLRRLQHVTVRNRLLSCLSAAVLAVVLLGLTPALASAGSMPRAASCRTPGGVKVTDANVCRGIAFYKGKTMTWVNIGSIGGPFDVPGIALTPYLTKYLGASVQVASYPTGSSIPGQNALAHATPDGLTIGMLNPLADIQDVLEHQPGINFNPIRLAFIAQNGLAADPLVASSSAGFSNFAQFYTAAKSGTLKVLYQPGTLGALLRIMMGVLGLHPQYVTGYNSQGAEVTGLIRGDAPVGLFDLSLICPLIQQGKGTVLTSLAIPPVGTNCRNFIVKAPTVAQLQKKYPPKTAKQKKEWSTLLTLIGLAANPIVTQTAVPSWKVATLRAAVKWTYQQPGFKKAMLQYGQNPTYGNPVKAKSAYATGLKLGPSVICYVQGTC